MGYIKHHAIVVTSWDSQRIEAAHAKAVETCNAVSPIVDSGINGYRSFFVAPDGSKEGWEDSAEGDIGRGLFVGWLYDREREDEGCYLEWAEIAYGSDYERARISRSAWSHASPPSVEHETP